MVLAGMYSAEFPLMRTAARKMYSSTVSQDSCVMSISSLDQLDCCIIKSSRDTIIILLVESTFALRYTVNIARLSGICCLQGLL